MNNGQRGNAVGHIELQMQSLSDRINMLDKEITDLVVEMQPVLQQVEPETMPEKPPIDPLASPIVAWVTEMDDKVLEMVMVIKSLNERSEL